jgi:hypothetical protein
MKLRDRLDTVLGTHFLSPRTGDAQRSVPPAALPRDKQGWGVAPAPDGRGTPDQSRRTPPHRISINHTKRRSP